MPRFDDYADRITVGLSLPEAAKEEIRQEALSHLEDEAARLMSEGRTRDEAEALAIEAFGKGDAIAALVDEALAGRQRRYRRVRSAINVTATVLLAVFVVGFGAWFSVFDDAVSGDAFVRQLPQYLFPVLYLGAGIWGLAILAGVSYRLSGVGKRALIAAVFGVLTVFVLAVVAFDFTPLRDTYGYIAGKETPGELAVKACVMRAWLTLVPACIVGAICIALGRDRRRTARLLAVAVLTGLLSSILMGASRLPYEWLRPYKWAKVTSVGLIALVFVVLAVLLARTIAERRGRNACT